jgi:hypothetical protein
VLAVPARGLARRLALGRSRSRYFPGCRRDEPSGQPQPKLAKIGQSRTTMEFVTSSWLGTPLCVPGRGSQGGGVSPPGSGAQPLLRARLVPSDRGSARPWPSWCEPAARLSS